MNPFELFTMEFPQLAGRFDELVGAQPSRGALPCRDGPALTEADRAGVAAHGCLVAGSSGDAAAEGGAGYPAA